jgi:hypothetical protein
LNAEHNPGSGLPGLVPGMWHIVPIEERSSGSLQHRKKVVKKGNFLTSTVDIRGSRYESVLGISLCVAHWSDATLLLFVVVSFSVTLFILGLTFH